MIRQIDRSRFGNIRLHCDTELIVCGQFECDRCQNGTRISFEAITVHMGHDHFIVQYDGGPIEFVESNVTTMQMISVNIFGQLVFFAIQIELSVGNAIANTSDRSTKVWIRG